MRRSQGATSAPFESEERKGEMTVGKIVMLAPFPDSSPLTHFAREEFKHLADMVVVGTDRGLDVITAYYHVEHHIGPVLDKAMEIEKSGDCEALIVGCFGDPGLVAVRQVTSMPVVGTGETSLCVAAILGDKIGIVVPQRDFVYVTEKMIHTYRFADRVVAVRSAENFVPESIQSRPDEAMKMMADTCLGIIREKEADVLIFGCIGFSWMIDEIRRFVASEGFSVPIVEPGITAYKSAKMIAELGLNQDRRKLAVSW
jgi:allantoin racemase